MAYIPAFDLQYIAVQVAAKVLPTPRPLDLSPPQGDATPQTHAVASLTG